MDEKQQALSQPLLPIYRPGHTIDVACVALIFLGTLLSAGFFSANPGSLVVPFCTVMYSWFGFWAMILSILMVLLGAAILVFRWMVPHIRMKKSRQILYPILVVLVLLDGIILSALYGGPEGGGSVGMGLLRLLVSEQSAMRSSFLLWTLLIIALCLLAGGLNWGPKLFRALAEELRDLVRSGREKVQKASEDDGMINFDWRTEYNSDEEAKEEAAEDEDPDDEQAAPEPVKKPAVSFVTAAIPSLFTRKKVVNMTNTENKKQQTAQKTTGTAERSNRLPPLNLLDAELGFYGQNADHRDFMRQIEEAMDEFGTPVRVIGCTIGPSVIQYQVVPGNIVKNGNANAKNIRVTQVANVERDLAVRLGVSNLSIQAPVPGESYIGIDIPNPQAMKVRLRSLIETPEFQRKNAPLSIALGRNISGDPVVVDLAQMPHLLVAGTTNSGKSICMRAMAICMAMNNTPDQLRFVMIDPKRVEFYHFNGLPHLLGKVETEYSRCIAVLQWAVQEMMARYKLFESIGARKLENYNQYAIEHGQKPLPYIVIIIDEMTDLMKGADKEGPVCIDKLTSLARATGMHMIMAAQRPDTTVITGKIKTNIPARIALNVASAIDSRVIMGKQGAEKLLGRGDMYFIDPSLNVPVRVQGALLTDKEIDKVVSLWKKLAPKPTAEANSAPWDEIAETNKQNESDRDGKKLKDAIRFVCKTKAASAAKIASNIGVSQPTATRLLARMEEMGIVGPMVVGGRSREVYMDEAEAEGIIRELKTDRKKEDNFDYDE